MDAEPAVVMSLEQALDALSADGPDVVAAQARAEAAHGVARQALAASLPLLQVGGSYTQNDQEVILSFSSLPLPVDPSLMPADRVLQPEQVFATSATLRVPLLAPTAWSEGAAAAAMARSADAGAEAAVRKLQAALVQTAASVQAARGIVEAAERAVPHAEAHRDAVQRAVSAGTESPVLALQASSDLLARRSELAQARADLARAEEALGSLLGVDGPVVIELPPPPPLTDDAPSAAVLAAEARLDATERRVDAAWLRHVPTISAYGTALYSSEPLISGDDTMWKLGVEATWAAYDGGLRYGKLTEARADRAAAQAALTGEQIRDQRARRDADREVAVAVERLTLAEERLSLAKEGARLARQGLDNGTVGALTARDAEERLFQADVGVEIARARHIAALAAQREAHGIGW